MEILKGIEFIYTTESIYEIFVNLYGNNPFDLYGFNDNGSLFLKLDKKEYAKRMKILELLSDIGKINYSFSHDDVHSLPSFDDIQNAMKKRNDLWTEVCNLLGEPQQSKTKTDKAKTQRTIDEEKSNSYFIASFKGKGNGNINFFNTMIDELKNERTSKEFAQIALMIYKGNKLNDRKPSTFAEWYTVFCECVGCEKKTYKPKDLKHFPENLQKLFNYL